MVQNHFLQAERAAEYDRYRPYFHPLVFSRVTHLTSTGCFARALDIGCGTGQSTRAMAAVSKQAVGLDASAAMLHQARSRGVPCILAAAERLPLAAGAFDLVAVGLAFHWFDRPAVLREARRVLTERGWLVIFNSWFAGSMHGNSAFARWYQDYLRRFPSPPRHTEPLTDYTMHAADFRQVASEAFAHRQVFTRDALVGYLKTQSNVSAAIDGGTESDTTATRWLMNSLEPVFAGAAGTFEFSGVLSLYQAAVPIGPSAASC